MFYLNSVWIEVLVLLIKNTFQFVVACDAKKFNSTTLGELEKAQVSKDSIWCTSIKPIPTDVFQ